MPKKLLPLPSLYDKTCTSIDLRGKTISISVLSKVSDALFDIEPGHTIDVATDAYEGIHNDMMAWGRMTGNTVRMLDATTTSFSSNTESSYRYVIEKKREKSHINDKSDTSDNKDKPQNQAKKVAIIISQDGLEEVLSPLGFAIASVLAGMDVSLYFQGPGVHLLRQNFKGYLKGFQRPFSFMARRGLVEAGHVGASEKLKLLHNMGAKFYACHPSLDNFGVKTSDMAFPEDVVLAEYMTFLEQMQNATIQLYP